MVRGKNARSKAVRDAAAVRAEIEQLYAQVQVERARRDAAAAAADEADMLASSLRDIEAQRDRLVAPELARVEQEVQWLQAQRDHLRRVLEPVDDGWHALTGHVISTIRQDTTGKAEVLERFSDLLGLAGGVSVVEEDGPTAQKDREARLRLQVARGDRSLGSARELLARQRLPEAVDLFSPLRRAPARAAVLVKAKTTPA